MFVSAVGSAQPQTDRLRHVVVTSCVSKQYTLRAEILWTLKICACHYSYKSSGDTSCLFAAMFPDSAIASKFSCGERKANYMTCHGLAPHFKDVLLTTVREQDAFVLLFDEIYNSVTMKKQMDVLVRMWTVDNRVTSRYLCSVFTGRDRASDILEQFLMNTQGLDLKNLLQVSMDGPSVNWAFYEKLQQKVKCECSCQILNIGSCGSHMMHEAFKHGCDATKWNIASVLHSVHSLFDGTPAHHEDYTRVTGSDLFGREFCNTRWLENVPVAECLLEMWTHVCEYVAAVKKGDIPLPETKAFGVVSEATCDPLFTVKLNCFVSVAKVMTPFLARYQTDRPMLPFLASDMHQMMKHLLYRFVKSDVVNDISLDSLSELIISDPALMRKTSDIDIGFMADAQLKQMQRSTRSIVSDRDVLGLCLECRDFIHKIVVRMLMTSPTKHSIVRNLTCLDPRKMASDPDACCAKLRNVLHTLVKNGRLATDKCDNILRQFSDVLTNVDLLNKDQFSSFDPFDDGQRVDVFLESHINCNDSLDLWNTVKQLLLLSHGQASIERGFSVDKQVEGDSLCEDTFVAHQIVHDHIMSVGGIMGVDMSKALMTSCQASEARYQAYLDDKKRVLESDSLKHKLVTEPDDLEAKKQYLEADIVELNGCADDLLINAEKKHDFSLLVKSNALRRSAKEKAEELLDIARQLDQLK